MLTNIVAAVTISFITNVVETSNATGWPGYTPGASPAVLGDTSWYKPYTPPTERYLTTNVTERTTVSLTVQGQPLTFHNDRLLSSVTAVLKLNQQWEAAGVRTNRLDLPWSVNDKGTVGGVLFR